MRLGDDPTEKLEIIKTGSISLNEALGVGGFPKRVELWKFMVQNLLEKQP